MRETRPATRANATARTQRNALSVEIEAAADSDTQPAPALVGEKAGEQQRQIAASAVLHETHRARRPPEVGERAADQPGRQQVEARSDQVQQRREAATEHDGRHVRPRLRMKSPAT